MLDLLIHTSDTLYLNQDLKIFDDTYDRVSCMKQGYLQRVMPTGHKWGKLELDRKRFLIVQIEDHQFKKEWLDLEYDIDGNEICDRLYRFPLDKILTIGELDSLKNIEYNSPEILSPIIKTVDLATIAEINNWDTQPDLIKLHGSAGTFEIQADGGGDYTSLKTAVETEAANLTGTGKAIFVIQESWTNPDTGNWDVDGYTTTSSDYIEIYAEGVASHDGGKIRATGWRTDDVTQMFDIEQNYTKVHDLQSDGQGALETSGAADGVELYNIVRKLPATNGGNCFNVNTASGDIVSISNCVGYETSATHAGIGASLGGFGTVNITNSTFYGFIRGIDTNAVACNCKNSLVFDNSDDFYDTFTSIDYCASDDGDGTNAITITQTASDYAALVTDAPNGDFSVKDASSELYNAGTNTGAPSDDIIGTSRPQATTVDIGAFEFITGTPPADIVILRRRIEGI